MEVIGRVESGTETESDAGSQSRVRLFLFRARREDDVHGCTSAVSAQAQGCAQVEQRRSSCRGCTGTAAHGRSLQGGRLHGCSRSKTSGTCFPATLLWMKTDGL